MSSLVLADDNCVISQAPPPPTAAWTALLMSWLLWSVRFETAVVLSVHTPTDSSPTRTHSLVISWWTGSSRLRESKVRCTLCYSVARLYSIDGWCIYTVGEYVLTPFSINKLMWGFLAMHVMCIAYVKVYGGCGWYGATVLSTHMSSGCYIVNYVCQCGCCDFSC